MSNSKKSKNIMRVEYQEPQLIPLPIMRGLVEIFYDFQGQRIATFNNVLMNCERNGISEEDLEKKYGVKSLIDEAKTFEDKIKKRLDSEVVNYKIYDKYLQHIQGIGSILSAGLVANIGDIAKFDTISKLWMYAGLGFNKFCPECEHPTYVNVEYEDREGNITKGKKLKPFENCPECNHKTNPIIQKRTKGYQDNWSPRLRVLCCIPDTMITGCPKPTLIQDVKKGDHVLGLRTYNQVIRNEKTSLVFDSQRTRFDDVEQKFERNYNGNVIAITPYFTNIPLVVTPEHPILAVKIKRNNKSRRKSVKGIPQWIQAKDLTEDHAIIQPRIQLDKSSIILKLKKLGKKQVPDSVETDSDMMFLFGLYLAEGWIRTSKTRKNGGVFFALNQNEHDLLEELQKSFKKKFGFNGIIKKSKIHKGMTIEFFSKSVGTLFYETLGNYYNKKIIPDYMMRMKPELIKSLIRGYFLGDGSIKGNDVRAVTASKILAHQITTLIRALGFPCGIWKDNNAFRIIIPASFSRKFAKNVLGKDLPKFKERNKVGLIRLSDTHFVTQIKKIENRKFRGKVYNMETKKSHTYTAEGILVHNCWKIGSSFVKQKAAKSGYRRIYESFRRDDTEFHPTKVKENGKTKYNDGHMYNRAVRKTVKIFMSHLWITWREMEGLEVKAPYVEKVLGHDIIKPFKDR